MPVFPKGPFVVGAGISAHQTEGGNTFSDWWRFEQTVLRKRGDDVSGDAVDHWHQYADDIGLLSDAGLNAFRCSLEWAKIEPKEGFYDQNAIEHYRHVLRRLRQRRVFACLTLWHFTLPTWAADHGGMEHPEVRRAFVRFAKRMCREFEGEVDLWLTMNEPMVYAMKGYRWGEWPPGIRSFTRTWRVIILLAFLHRRVYRVFKECTHVPVGLAKSFISFHVGRRHALHDRIIAWWKNVVWNDAFFWLTIGSNDAIGVNYYIGETVGSGGRKQPTDDMGWAIWPEGFRLALLRATKHGLPIYITENGIATEDDGRRIVYIRKHLAALKDVKERADIRGYFYWSLLDNFEWDKGFEKRFGLIAVDRSTMQRIPKPSLAALGRMAKTMR